MRQFLFFILYVLSFDISAQKIPKNSNAYDLDSNKIGTWTIFFDSNWNVTDNIDSTTFYRIIDYDTFPIPIKDYYLNGCIEFEGFLLTDHPEDMLINGIHIWYDTNEDTIQIRNINELGYVDNYYQNNSPILSVESLKNDTVLNYTILSIDSNNFDLDILYNLDNYYYKSKDEYLNKFKTYLKFEEVKYGKFNKESAITYQLMARTCYDFNDLSNSKFFLNKSLDIYKNLNVEYSEHIEEIYYELSNIYSKINNEQNAVKYINKIIEYKKIYFGDESIEYATALSHLGHIYQNLKKFDKSLKINLESLEIFYNKKNSNSIHRDSLMLDIARIKSNIGINYHEKGDFESAIKYDEEALSIYQKITGKESLDYARVLSNLACNYQDLGLYNKSCILQKESVNIFEVYGMTNEYTSSLDNLSVFLLSNGEIIEAFELLNKILHIKKERNGTGNVDYALSLGNYASVLYELGDYENSIEQLNNSVDIYEKNFGNTHPEYLRSLSNLGVMHSNLGNYEEAFFIHLEALEKREKVLGEYHPDVLLSMNNLASSFCDYEDYDEAIELYNEVLKRNHKIYSIDHPYNAYVLTNLASTFYKNQNYDSSLIYQEKSFEIISDFFKNDHPSYINSLSALSTIEYALLNFDNSYFYADNVKKINLSKLKSYENSLNQKYLELYFNYSWEWYNFSVLLNQSINNSEYVLDNYLTYNFLKGRSLLRKMNLYSKINSSKNKSLIYDFEKLIYTNSLITAQYENELIEFDLDSLISLSERLERKLVKKSNELRSTFTEYNFFDITKYLKEDEIYIDVLNLNKIDPSNFSYYEDSIDVIVYITKKNSISPELVYLGTSSELDSIYNYYSIFTKERPSNKEFSNADIVLGNVCYQNLWSKIEPYLEGVSTVYFSPEGVYSKINPNVLYDSTSSSFLMDKYDIVYVSNVEDFVHQKENIQLYERPDDLYAVLIGNPTFLLEDVVVFASNEPQSRSINQDELDSFQRGMLLSDLPATQTEIDLISDNLKSKGWDVELISGVDATETRIKSIKSPKILHIATHGFFFEDQKMVKRSNMISTDNKKAVANPMTRSGLIFSGAENTMNGEILADDNGWLNSYEASLLNLRGTELVVLSACETGTGDVQNGKGVYGLQRAIRVAGAESLIMSMWEVDDKATQELMTYFYDYWIDKKMTKKDAFNKAQQKIREKYKHPYYWGAFIMLGE